MKILFKHMRLSWSVLNTNSVQDFTIIVSRVPSGSQPIFISKCLRMLSRMLNIINPPKIYQNLTNDYIVTLPRIFEHSALIFLKIMAWRNPFEDSVKYSTMLFVNFVSTIVWEYCPRFYDNFYNPAKICTKHSFKLVSFISRSLWEH